jgi:hypothetical protein
MEIHRSTLCDIWNGGERKRIDISTISWSFLCNIFRNPKNYILLLSANSAEELWGIKITNKVLSYGRVWSNPVVSADWWPFYTLKVIRNLFSACYFMWPLKFYRWGNLNNLIRWVDIKRHISSDIKLWALAIVSHFLDVPQFYSKWGSFPC